MSSLHGAVVLVTGANGGIGTHFVSEALARGAAKVYATARNPRPGATSVSSPRPRRHRSRSIAAAVEAAPDVTVLINNAGASVSSAGILTHTDEEIRAERRDQLPRPAFPRPGLRSRPRGARARRRSSTSTPR